MSYNKYAKRTDANQKEIVESLRDIGVQVIVTNFGDSYPDLMIAYSTWVLVEIKDKDTPVKRGQMEFMAQAKGYVGIALTFEEAKRLARNPEIFALSKKDKDRIATFLCGWSGKQMAIGKFRKEVLGK